MGASIREIFVAIAFGTIVYRVQTQISPLERLYRLKGLATCRADRSFHKSRIHTAFGGGKDQATSWMRLKIENPNFAATATAYRQ
jgi:hypothetical protein